MSPDAERSILLAARLSGAPALTPSDIATIARHTAPEVAVSDLAFNEADFITLGASAVNSVVIAEGPLYKWPSGYGLSGMTNENNQGIVSIGVPSTAARRPLAKEHYITDKHQINATVTFEDRAWDTNSTSLSGAAIVLNAPVHIKVYLGGLIGTAATK